MPAGLRFIPTCVGNTHCVEFAHLRSPVHPHVRGEHSFLKNSSRTLVGSSPRAWGTRELRVVPAGGERFIPTCVGNTRPSTRRPLRRPVHPHVRGEHQLPAGAWLREVGSSPRAWGTRVVGREFVDDGRFIPTCVGNTVFCSSVSLSPPVHPHVRGEHYSAAKGSARCTGSSPRAWGTHPRECVHHHRGRFIPTCVGNTSATFSALSSKSGSSPRAWGTRAHAWPVGCD